MARSGQAWQAGTGIEWQGGEWQGVAGVTSQGYAPLGKDWHGRQGPAGPG